MPAAGRKKDPSTVFPDRRARPVAFRCRWSGRRDGFFPLAGSRAFAASLPPPCKSLMLAIFVLLRENFEATSRRLQALQPGDEESVPARSAFVTWEGNHHEYDLCRLPAAARGAPGIDRNGRVPGGLRGLWWLRPTAAAAPARRQLGPGDLGPKQLAMRRIK